VDTVILEVKYAVRSILAAPKFAAVVLLTLALGIGANTAVFGVLNAIVLKPLPYAEPEQLVRVYHAAGSENSYLTGLAAVGYRDRSKTLDIAVTSTYSVVGADLTGRGEPERVTMLPVGADYFGVLRARPLLGQPFGRADERPNANVAVVSERIWRKYLDARTDAIGEVLALNGIPYRIAAVLPDDFDDPIESGVDRAGRVRGRRRIAGHRGRHGELDSRPRRDEGRSARRGPQHVAPGVLVANSGVHRANTSTSTWTD
jgi:hypothetical protein